MKLRCRRGVYFRMGASVQEWLAARRSPKAKPIPKYTLAVLALPAMCIGNTVGPELLRDTGLRRCRSCSCPEDEMPPRREREMPEDCFFLCYTCTGPEGRVFHQAMTEESGGVYAIRRTGDSGSVSHLQAPNQRQPAGFS